MVRSRVSALPVWRTAVWTCIVFGTFVELDHPRGHLTTAHGGNIPERATSAGEPKPAGPQGTIVSGDCPGHVNTTKGAKRPDDASTPGAHSTDYLAGQSPHRTSCNRRCHDAKTGNQVLAAQMGPATARIYETQTRDSDPAQPRTRDSSSTNDDTRDVQTTRGTRGHPKDPVDAHHPRSNPREGKNGNGKTKTEKISVKTHHWTVVVGIMMSFIKSVKNLMFCKCKFSCFSNLRVRCFVIFVFLLISQIPLSSPFGYHSAPITQVLSHDDTHYLVFDQVGEMAASTSYVHVMLPLNISGLATQAQVIEKELTRLEHAKAKNISQVIVTGQLKEIARSLGLRLNKSTNQLRHLDNILPDLIPTRPRYGRELDFENFNSENFDFNFNDFSFENTDFKNSDFISEKFVANETWSQDKEPYPDLTRTKRGVWVPATAMAGAALPALAITLVALTRIGVEVTKENNSKKFRQNFKQYTEKDWHRIAVIDAIKQDDIHREKLSEKLKQAFDLLPPLYQEAFDTSDYEIPAVAVFPKNQVPSEVNISYIHQHTETLKRAIKELDAQILLLSQSEFTHFRNPERFIRQANDQTNNTALTLYSFLMTLKFSETPDELNQRLKEGTDIFVPVSTLTTDRHRIKRFAAELTLAMIGLGTRIVGTFMGLYNAAELRAITNRVTNLEHTQNLLIQLSQKHSDELKTLHNGVIQLTNLFLSFMEINPAIVYAKFNEHLIELETRVQRVVNAIQQLQHRRLAVDWLDPEQLTALHESVKRFADEHDYTLLTKQHSDYFQLETSYLRTESDVLAVLHIPCIMAPSMLSIYRYVPFPIPLPTVTSSSPYSIAQALYPSRLAHNDSLPDLKPPTVSTPEALYLVADADMIAIDKDNNFRLLSQADLAGCIQRNHVYLCEQQHVLRTNLTETCLGSLYHKLPQGVRENCRFDRRPLQERVYQMSSNEYLVYSPHPFTTRLACLNGSSYTADFGQTTRLFVPNGCSVQLKAHTLRVDEKYHVPLPPEISEWKWNPLELPADLLDRSVHLDFNLQSLARHLSQLRNDSTLDIELPALIDDHLQTGSTFGILIWFLLCLASLSPVVMFAWYWYRRQRRLSRPVRYDGHYVTIEAAHAYPLQPPAPIHYREPDHAHAPPMYPAV